MPFQLLYKTILAACYMVQVFEKYPAAICIGTIGVGLMYPDAK